MGAITSLFSGGGADIPDPPQVAPMPDREEITEDVSTRNAELRKLRARAGGVRSTLLGSQLGKTGNSGNPSGLLGRSL